jgi:hypothetical protein
VTAASAHPSTPPIAQQSVGAAQRGAPGRWQGVLDELLGRIAGRFARVEPRRRTRAFVLGLLADLPRKTCWSLAEHAGNHRQTRCNTW